MPKAVFLTADGVRLEGELTAGYSLMEAAVQLGIPAIRAECGGAAACATCHVHVDPAWADRAGPPSTTEQDLLALVSSADAYSRLSCQLIMRDTLDGIVLHVPAFD